jgi:hypothetical protein
MTRSLALRIMWIGLLVIVAAGAMIAANLALLNVADDEPVGRLSLRAPVAPLGAADARSVQPGAGATLEAPLPAVSPREAPSGRDTDDDGRRDRDEQEFEDERLEGRDEDD